MGRRIATTMQRACRRRGSPVEKRAPSRAPSVVLGSAPRPAVSGLLAIVLGGTLEGAARTGKHTMRIVHRIARLIESTILGTVALVSGAREATVGLVGHLSERLDATLSGGARAA